MLLFTDVVLVFPIKESCKKLFGDRKLSLALLCSGVFKVFSSGDNRNTGAIGKFVTAVFFVLSNGVDWTKDTAESVQLLVTSTSETGNNTGEGMFEPDVKLLSATAPNALCLDLLFTGIIGDMCSMDEILSEFFLITFVSFWFVANGLETTFVVFLLYCFPKLNAEITGPLVLDFCNGSLFSLSVFFIRHLGAGCSGFLSGL